MEDVNSFRKAMGFLLKWEGGYVNDPDDPGGETKWGISRKSYPNINIKEMTAEDACAIYAKDYWDACGCDAIPFPLNVAVFDSAVNCGTNRARDWVKKAKDSKEFLELRKRHYIDTVNRNPTQIKYMSGWLNRLNDLKKFLEVSEPVEPKVLRI